MSLFDLPKWFWKFVVGLLFNKPAQFLVMRYYDVRYFFDKRKEAKQKKIEEDRKARIRELRSSGKTRRRPR